MESGFGGFVETLVERITATFWGEATVHSQLYFDGWLWAFAAAGTLVALPLTGQKLREKWKNPGPIFIERTQVEFASILAVFCGAGLLVGFASFQELHSHYFALLSPFFAVIGAVGLQKIGAALVHKPGHRGRRFGAGVLLLALACTPVSRQEFSRSAWESESTQMGESVAYPAEESVEDEVTRVIREIFWLPERVKGSSYSPISHYLWSKRRSFSTADLLQERVRERVHPNETLMGASSMAPLLALLAERDLAGQEADTNSKRVSSGLMSDRAWATLACKEDVRLIVGTSRPFFSHRKMTGHPY